jgi:BirA family biotin operon repressor/biotin-[acetyl-CoA-carboxylase] ligase
MHAEGDQVAHMTIGIGLNINNAPETEEPMAISLKVLLGRSVPRREILVAFLDAFKQRMAAFDPQAIIGQWKLNNVTLGRQVRIVTANQRLEGTAVDVNPHGGLILQVADGTQQTVIYGDCFHREGDGLK